MSCSSVCQGLQSCLEPRLVEPHGSRLKLAPPRSIFSRSTPPTPSLDNLKKEMNYHTEENKTNTTITTSTDNKTMSNDCDVKSPKAVDMGGWSFLQFLNNNFHNTNHENDKVYVHPLVKRSSSTLSQKSLEMCTESLGSETGSQVSESSDEISLIASETDICTTQELPKPRENFGTNRTNRRVSFPPPLPSISGSTGVQVRPHREGGRLILEAVTFSSSRSYFHAERSEGRLRLRLVKDSSPIMDDEDDQEEEEEEAEEHGHGEEAFDEEEQVETKEETLGYDAENGDRDAENVEGEAEGEDGACWGEDIEGNNEKVKDQIGLPRPSSCKEGGCGNKGLVHWEPFLVAT